MEAVFHENQEGSLCAQHCLNALLQGSYFTAVDLATLASQMDDAERQRMAESGFDTEEYRQFIQQPSQNMDDSGYFSVQVISSALAVWGLELVPYGSLDPRAQSSKHNPLNGRAYICNYRDHWFAIRKIGNQWFNLNSLLTGPELVSDMYLSLLLAQLLQEGYSIFTVIGKLPDCDADALLLQTPAVQNVKPRLTTAGNKSKTKGGVGSQEQGGEGSTNNDQTEAEDAELQAALKMSMDFMEEEEEREQLQRAMKISLTESRLSKKTHNQDTASTASSDPHGSAVSPSGANANFSTLDEEDNDLREALRMSLEGCGESNNVAASSSAVNPVVSTTEDVRRRRLASLERLNTPPQQSTEGKGSPCSKDS